MSSLGPIGEARLTPKNYMCSTSCRAVTPGACTMQKLAQIRDFAADILARMWGREGRHDP